MIPGMTLDGLAYTTTPHDRMPGHRGDPRWIAEQLAAPGSRVTPLWRDRCLLGSDGRPVTLTGAAGRAVVEAAVQTVLLGMDGQTAVFAADLDCPSEAEALRLCDATGSADLRALAAALPGPVAATLAYARGLLYWNRHARFCGSCGAPADSVQAGHVRLCGNAGCGRELFPRVEPAVIVLVESPGPEPRCLLARHRGAGPDRFALLAGFVEIGESLEGAVRREVAEEAGIAVTDVTYQGSQGWPSPLG